MYLHIIAIHCFRLFLEGKEKRMERKILSLIWVEMKEELVLPVQRQTRLKVLKLIKSL
jgi:hypothetical protein